MPHANALYLMVVPMLAWIWAVAYVVRRMDVPDETAPGPSRAAIVIGAALCPLPMESCGSTAILAMGPGARGRDLVCFETLIAGAAARRCEVAHSVGHYGT